jgi:outer membrane protein
MQRFVLSSGLAALLAGAAPAHAADGDRPDWFVKVAATRLTLADDIELTVGGAPVPNAGMNTKPHVTPTVHVGRFVADNVAVAFTGGLPPHISIVGRDALQPFGKLAETTYGPATLMVQYHLNRDGTVRPYVGVGACYMLVFSAKDGSFQDVEIDNDLAPSLEAGVEFMVTKRHGLFLEAKKAFLRTEARGNFGGAPVAADIRLDPWAISAGATIHF